MARSQTVSGAAPQQRVGLRRRDEAAAGREHHRPLVVEHGLQHVALEAAIVVLAVQREELGEAQVGGLLDAAVELDEGHAQPARQPAADRRLARAAQAEQRDDRFGVAPPAAR